MTSEEIAAKISQRRRQILVHSIIYYRLDDSIIPDHKWAEWARELVDLQEKYPKIAETCELAAAFKGFDASTGYDLPLGDAHYHTVAEWLLDYHRRMGGEIHET
jgi:hypothetical protein